MANNMEEYKKFLKQLADVNSDKFVNNSSVDHAAAMIEELFRKANGEVRILTDHLNPAVYTQTGVKEASVEFLQKKDSRLKVIMQFNEENTTSPSGNGFLSNLKEFKDKITLYKADAEQKKIKNHFMVSTTDKNNYALRFETDIESHIATGTFNAGEPGKTLCVYFDKMVESIAPINNNTVWPN